MLRLLALLLPPLLHNKLLMRPLPKLRSKQLQHKLLPMLPPLKQRRMPLMLPHKLPLLKLLA